MEGEREGGKKKGKEDKGERGKQGEEKGGGERIHLLLHLKRVLVFQASQAGSWIRTPVLKLWNKSFRSLRRATLSC